MYKQVQEIIFEMKNGEYMTVFAVFNVWSGKRGSNSRPQPWQGCALPAELFPPN